MTLWETRRAELERLYLSEGYSQGDLAARYGVSQPAILRAMRRLGIPARPAKFTGKLGRPETPVRAPSVTPAAPVFAKTGWWNPAAPTGGQKRMVRGMCSAEI